MTQDVRAAAAAVIGEVLGGSSLQQALPGRLNQVSPRDRGLLQQLCYGTLRHSPRLQAVLAQLLEKPLRDKDRDLHGLLLCGLYQLDSTRVPDHAAVAATVGAARVLKKHWATGMANAVLRRYLREREQLAEALDPAAAASHPSWLFQKIMQQWPSAASEIMQANNQQPPMTLRINHRCSARSEYLADLQQQGFIATIGMLSPHAIQLATPTEVQELPGFSVGAVSVQDEAAQLAAVLLHAGVGERVLDACSAPGGKACHILEMQPHLLELVAMDIDTARLQRVAENLQRLGLAATLMVGDAVHPPAQLVPDSFDRILADVPCSASGVIRRHPDIKLLRRETDIAQFAQRQQGILTGLWPLLKPGGILLYVTCSILDEENSQVVQGFLAGHPDAELCLENMPWGQARACGRQLLPSVDGPDGLFYSRIRKTA